MMTVDEALKMAESAGFADTTKAILAAEVRRLRTELEQERKRLDWALKNEAVYYVWGGVWRLCFQCEDGPCPHDIDTDNPRATIDELMEKTT